MKRLAAIFRPAPALRLLGAGLDAIIQHTRRPPEGLIDAVFFPAGHDDARLPVSPTEYHRRERYDIACVLAFAGGANPDLERRRMVGEQLQRAWQLGQLPPAVRAKRAPLRLVGGSRKATWQRAWT